MSSISIHASISITKQSLDLLKQLYLIGKNWLFRPKLSVDTNQQKIVFVSQNDEEHHHNYFCFLIRNDSNRKVHLNLKKIKINNESYQVVLQSDPNFLHLNPETKKCWKDCKNDIYKEYSKNWHDISQNIYTLEIAPHATKVFPAKLIKENSHILTSIKNNSLLIFSKKKISLTIEANNKIYEYGINRTFVYNKYINYLAFCHGQELCKYCGKHGF